MDGKSEIYQEPQLNLEQSGGSPAMEKYARRTYISPIVVRLNARRVTQNTKASGCDGPVTSGVGGCSGY